MYLDKVVIKINQQLGLGKIFLKFLPDRMDIRCFLTELKSMGGGDVFLVFHPFFIMLRTVCCLFYMSKTIASTHRRMNLT